MKKKDPTFRGAKAYAYKNGIIKVDYLAGTAKQFGVTSVDAKERLHNLCGQFQRLHLKVKKSIKIEAGAD
jgi:hypothetical protein